MSRLNNVIKEVTESLEKFNSTKTSQAIEDFWINDLSLWYVRRSRKRFQNPENNEDKEQASRVFYYVLLTITKAIAPFMPFLAEEIYQKLKVGEMPQSVHLCEYPQYDKKAIDEKLEQEMQAVREVVSLALAKRTELGIGVRQALSKLKIKNEKLKTIIKNEKLSELMRDEVNIKEVVFDENIEGAVELDTIITDELKEEGRVREIIRHIQDLRKKAGLTPKDMVVLYFASQNELAEIIRRNQAQILKTTKLQSLKENPEKQGEFLVQKEAKVDVMSLWLAIAKI